MNWFFIIIGVLVAFCVFGIIYEAKQEYEFSKIIPEEVECSLIECSYSPSTLETRVAPVFTGKTTSCVIYTTGDSEQTITIWDCGKYGRLVCKDSHIYRYAKERSVLLIRNSDYATRIIGIKIEEKR